MKNLFVGALLLANILFNVKASLAQFPFIEQEDLKLAKGKILVVQLLNSDIKNHEEQNKYIKKIYSDGIKLMSSVVFMTPSEI